MGLALGALAKRQVLAQLERDSAEHHATDLPSGTVYPILRRLNDDGLVKSRWERDAVARRQQRPPRRYYELTAAGETTLADARARYRALEMLAARMAPGWKPA
jgi:DNA-binding PadR family transcriptional regulator